MVYADSFRHMIYNTLWTSNRLIKYILYKYISYCTRRPLGSHCDSMPQVKPAVLGRTMMPASSLCTLQPVTSTPWGEGEWPGILLPLTQILKRLTNPQSTTFSQCLLPWVYAANGQKGKEWRKPPSFNVRTFHALCM
uniref:Uncharacterized protein n=1 Tax=Myotis myotis TaxID=51298 RepID=A0A7J7SC55_MYOMY|nr:hypothetical protein mMyoMyo1_009507 [Myotis myotis]